MSDIEHRHIGSNLSHRRWKGDRAAIPDAPKLQHLVYDIAATGHSTFCARGGHKMPLHGGTTVWGGY